MSLVFEQVRKITRDDIDALNHVNNIRWLEFVVELAEAHSESVGLDFNGYKNLGGVFVVRRHEITYLGQALLDEEITGKTWIVDELKGAQSKRKYEFFRGEKKLLIAETDWVFVDLKTLRPKAIPAEVAEKFQVSARPQITF